MFPQLSRYALTWKNLGVVPLVEPILISQVSEGSFHSVSVAFVPV